MTGGKTKHQKQVAVEITKEEGKKRGCKNEMRHKSHEV
jgi:hypothetical protein